MLGGVWKKLFPLKPVEVTAQQRIETIQRSLEQNQSTAAALFVKDGGAAGGSGGAGTGGSGSGRRGGEQDDTSTLSLLRVTVMNQLTMAHAKVARGAGDMG